MLLLRELCGEAGSVALNSSSDGDSEYAQQGSSLNSGWHLRAALLGWRFRRDSTAWHIRVCRTVLILTMLLTVLMPLTEHFCRWDRFLEGGPDVEFGFLGILLFAGLVLLVAKRSPAAPLLCLLLAYRLTIGPTACWRGLVFALSRGIETVARLGEEALQAPAQFPRMPLRV